MTKYQVILGDKKELNYLETATAAKSTALAK